MAVIGQAPGELRTVQAFVNTLDIEQATDELASPAALDQWLTAAGLAGESGVSPVTPGSGPADLALAIELREALRRILLAHVAPPAGPPGARSAPGSVPSPARPMTLDGAVARLAGVAAAAAPPAIITRPDGSVGVGVGVAAGSRAALTRLLLIAGEAATAGTWTRLKACSADDCHWAFYDRSPTRNGCWCSMQICGSRAKSRAYRSRAARPG
jgi:predicted RNA-binding Zn ribbon-like protein